LKAKKEKRYTAEIKLQILLKILLQLLELQSRFGMDSRFKLDGRFADGADETKTDSENEDSELAKQMSILEKVVGPLSRKSKAQDKYETK
jgi:hypothetical protein